MSSFARAGPIRGPGTRARGIRAWLVAFALLAAIRFLTMAPDAWQWDEVLLADAVAHGIDLREHRPHPPGYPLLVEAAALVHGAGIEPYRSLAIVGTTGGLLAAAALAAFLVAAGLDVDFACLGGLLYALIPSVWLFGVRGFSDAPAAAASLAAGAAFLAGSRASDGRLTALGMALTASAAGFRPQCAIALVPLGVASIVGCLRRDPRSWRWLLAGLTTGAALTVLIWRPAIVGSGGLGHFREQLAVQAADVRRNVLIAPGDLLSRAVWRRWLVDPFGWDALFWVFAGLALVATIRRRLLTLRLLAVVLPWAFVNVPGSALFAAPRYATFLLAGVAGLAAGGLAVLSRPFARGSAGAGVLLAAATAAAGLPAIVEVANRPSPPAEAIDAVSSGPYARGMIVHDPALRMHVSRILRSRARSEIADSRAVVADAGDVVLVADRTLPGLLEERRFAYGTPLLARLSHGVLMSVQMGVAMASLSVGTRDAAPGTETVRYDNDIPVSIDRPGDGEIVRGRLRVSGWCQMRGGGAVEPFEFRIDGQLVRPVRVDRTPRPDVASAIPLIGDALRAGYEAELDVSGLSPGVRVLRVTFRASDGRTRVSQPVRFVWSP